MPSGSQPPADDVEWTTGVNFFRRQYYDERNRRLVDACKQVDRAFVAQHIATQDRAHPERFRDELFEHRVGMQAVHALLESGPRRRVLDVACGNAELLRRLAASGHTVAGVDVSPVRVANNRPDIPRLAIGFAEDIPHPDASFDAVVALESLEHVMDLDRTLQEIHRVLVDDGLFLCQVPEGTFADGENHVRLFTPDRLRWCCETAGFETLSLLRIPYLVGEPPLNLFLVARRPAAGA